jgi:hypothetical protein
MSLYNIIINLCNVFMCHNDDISLMKIIINNENKAEIINNDNKAEIKDNENKAEIINNDNKAEIKDNENKAEIKDNDNKAEIKDNENIVSQNTTKDLSEDEIKELFHKQYPSFEGNDFFLKFYKYNKKQGVEFFKRFDFYFLFLNFGFFLHSFFLSFFPLKQDKNNIERILQTIMRILRIIIMFLLIYSFVFIRKKKLNKKNFIFMKFCTTLITTINIVLLALSFYEKFLTQSDYDNFYNFCYDHITLQYGTHADFMRLKKGKRARLANLYENQRKAKLFQQYRKVLSLFFSLIRLILIPILIFQQAYGFGIIENTPLNKNGNFSFSLLMFFDARCIFLIIFILEALYKGFNVQPLKQ